MGARGRSAAFITAWEGHSSIMELLIKHGLNVSSRAVHDEWTTLHKAAEQGHEDIVRMLLDAGAPPDTRSLPDKQFPNGTTPLELTKKEAVVEMIRTAIEQQESVTESLAPPVAV